MIVRELERGYLCIPQSQHAAVSGQIARAWGNEAFPSPVPAREVCLAAERHDDGMDLYDAAPALDRGTRLPLSFMRMPLEPWLECWRRGPSLVANDSPYAGILVSLHGTGLLGYRDIEAGSAEADLVATYVAEQEELRERLAGLAAEAPEVSVHLDADTLERNRNLIALWDAMSLAVCMPRLPSSFDTARAGSRDPTLAMTEVAEPGVGEILVEVEPWPFSPPKVPLVAHGWLLTSTFEDPEEMRRALAEAPTESLAAAIVPRGWRHLLG